MSTSGQMADHTGSPEFETGMLEASAIMEEPSEKPHEVQIGPDVAAILGLMTLEEATITTPPKTFKFQGKLFAGGGVLAATLENATVTVTRGQDSQTGTVFLVTNFTYEVVSHGFRTGEGSSGGRHEPLGMEHGLYFKDRNSGPMSSWGFPTDPLIVRCEWSGEFRHHHIQQDHFVSWFDFLTEIEHRASGALFRC